MNRLLRFVVLLVLLDGDHVASNPSSPHMITPVRALHLLPVPVLPVLLLRIHS